MKLDTGQNNAGHRGRLHCNHVHLEDLLGKLPGQERDGNGFCGLRVVPRNALASDMGRASQSRGRASRLWKHLGQQRHALAVHDSVAWQFVGILARCEMTGIGCHGVIEMQRSNRIGNLAIEFS